MSVSMVAGSCPRVSLWLRIGAYSGLVVVSVLSLYPFVLMILNSLKSNTQVLLNTSGLPSPPTVSTYSQLFSGGGERGFVNSLIIAGITTVGTVFLSALAGYAFAKVYFRVAQCSSCSCC